MKTNSEVRLFVCLSSIVDDDAKNENTRCCEFINLSWRNARDFSSIKVNELIIHNNKTRWFQLCQ